MWVFCETATRHPNAFKIISIAPICRKTWTVYYTNALSFYWNSVRKECERSNPFLQAPMAGIWPTYKAANFRTLTMYVDPAS